MTGPVAMPDRGRLPWRQRPVTWLAVGLARVLAEQPPGRIRWLLHQLRRGARPASLAEAQAARAAVVATSTLCAGEGCLPRSIATTLLCRLRGTWPTWCTGVRTAPFAAHAWVEAAGAAVDEPYPAGYFRVVMAVPPPGPHGGR